MRKPTNELREWNRIHEHNLNKRKFKKREQRRRKKHRTQWKTRRPQSRKVQFRQRVTGLQGSRLRIPCPERLSLEDNFDEVTELLSTIRDQSYWTRKRLYIDFRPIQQVTPSGALVLAAELDRVNHLKTGRSLRQVDAERWNPNVRRLLKEMGFFRLLRTSSPTAEPRLSDDQYIEFRSGATVDGEVVDELRRLVDPHVTVPNKQMLFSAVTEAMTNVRHHAYEDHRSYLTDPQFWWLSAAFNVEKKEFFIMIYDQGSGIPETLTKKWSEIVRQRLPGDMFRDHSRLIEAAHELSRSRTGEWYRGRGFDRDIRRYIERLDEGKGMYRIISGRGEYTVESGASGIRTRRSFNGILRGTFIQWRIELI